ncbi:class C sortase [Corynebacterium glutamicum]|uniref:class C sortase n=1 Tax=Corynebacterium glutamicum TaxID=1718 RepID=UPI001B8CF2FA|nr:class C sortase [Corynebacterium glutamicum]
MGATTSPAPKHASSKKSSLGYQLRFVVAPIALVLIGLSIMLAPVVSTQYHNWQFGQETRQYSEEIARLEESTLAAELLEAQEWNAYAHTPQAIDPWTGAVDPNTQEHQHYLEQLNILPSMARVRVPSVGIDLPIYHGTDEETLAKGVGHLYGTDLPVGGVGTHSVLNGHTGIATATLFDNLIDVSLGDLIAVDVLGETHTYQVKDTNVVLPNNTDSIQVNPHSDLLTLITCTPYGINSHRLLVTGERVFDQAVPEQSPFVIQPWMLWALGLSLAIIAITMLWIVLRKKGSQ